jgi:hypothetical protein
MFEWGRYSDGKGTPNLLRGEKQKFSSGIRTPSQYPRSLQPSKVASSLHPRPPFANRWGNYVTIRRFRNRGAATSDTRAFCWIWVLARHYSGTKGDPLTDILSLTSARCAEVGILVARGTWAPRFPPPQKDQALGQAAAETQTVNAITAARHQSAAVSLVPPLAELMAQTPFVPFSASESPLPFFRPLSAFSSLPPSCLRLSVFESLPPFCLPPSISESSQLSCLPPGASSFEPPSLPHCDLP